MDLREARRLADVALRPDWTPLMPATAPRPAGPFMVSETGWEDADGFGVAVGPAQAMPTKATHIVSKKDRSVRAITAADSTRLSAMLTVRL